MTEKNLPISAFYCSFCGSSQYEVRKLIAAPTAFICNECVELCVDIFKEEKIPPYDTENTPTAREKDLESLLRPLAQFGQALLAMEKIGDVGKLEDNNCVAAVSGGGGTFMLLWKHFNEIILYLYR